MELLTIFIRIGEMTITYLYFLFFYYRYIYYQITRSVVRLLFEIHATRIVTRGVGDIHIVL